jgi:rRNA-processing protein FCF1
MQYIIVDTSSIVFALSNMKDPFQAVRETSPYYSPVISDGIIRELGAIKARGEKNSKYAAAALLLVPLSNVEVVKDASPVDRWIERYAKKAGYAVCTNDVALKKSLKKARIRAFSITRSGTLR